MTRFSTYFNPTKILDTLQRLQTALSFNEEKFSSLLNLRLDEYRQLHSTHTPPSLQAIERLADQIDLCPEAILSGNINYAILSSRFSGCPTILPEKYTFASYSKRRTSIHLLDSIETRFGWKMRSDILKELQVNEAIFLDPDGFISIQFLVDLCSAIQSRLPQKDILFEMGKTSVNSNYHSKLGEIYLRLAGPKQIYENTFPELAKLYYDLNTHYKILKLSDTHCTLKTTPNPLLLELLKSKTIGSLGTCEQKRGVIACYPAYQHLPHAKVIETQCMHRGDLHCIFDIDFEYSTHINRVRKLRSSQVSHSRVVNGSVAS